jgi:hypothetical protein
MKFSRLLLMGTTLPNLIEIISVVSEKKHDNRQTGTTFLSCFYSARLGQGRYKNCLFSVVDNVFRILEKSVK